MAIALKKSDIREALVAFFEDQNKVLNIREYNEADKEGKAPYPLKFVEKHLGNYKKVIRMLERQDAARLAAIGTKPVEVQVKEPAPVLEPAQEEELSPLDKLRASTGESSE
jgi:predicted GH43/DUF377 family glycosyl hydrolase